jgi:hypothetical protein
MAESGLDALKLNPVLERSAIKNNTVVEIRRRTENMMGVAVNGLVGGVIWNGC